MIFGIGTDLVELQRIDAAYQRHGARFAARLLSPSEQTQLDAHRDIPRFLAKRWAAKEAFAKALGTGIRPPIRLAGITITHDAMGRPGLAFDDAIAQYLASVGVGSAHLSLSDERDVAIAFVVLETKRLPQL